MRFLPKLVVLAGLIAVCIQLNGIVIAYAEPYSEYERAFRRMDEQRNDYGNTAKHFPHYTRALEKHQSQRARLYGDEPSVSITIRRVPGRYPSQSYANRAPKSRWAQIERKLAELLRDKMLVQQKNLFSYLMNTDRARV